MLGTSLVSFQGHSEVNQHSKYLNFVYFLCGSVLVVLKLVFLVVLSSVMVVFGSVMVVLGSGMVVAW